MRKFIALFLFTSSFLFAQNDSTFVDHKYLEDQLYLNFTYIGLLNTPSQISKSGFSYGLALGFIKDIPFNKQRNVGIGVGLGYGLNAYYFNVKETSSPDPEEDLTELRSNKIAIHTIEMPFELRFRTSTFEKYRFWRLYPGFKIAYVFATNSNLKQREDFLVEDVVKVDDFLYGVTLSMGHNKWNAHIYYGLNNVFSEAENNDYKFGISDIRIGLIFYIL